MSAACLDKSKLVQHCPPRTLSGLADCLNHGCRQRSMVQVSPSFYCNSASINFIVSTASSLTQVLVASFIKMATVQYFDAAVLLKFHNPDKGRVSCVGYAPSQRRRCQNVIRKDNITKGQVLAEQLSGLSRNSKQLHSHLLDIAECLLCQRNHQDQAEDMAEEWSHIISHAVRTQQPKAVSPPARRPEPLSAKKPKLAFEFTPFKRQRWLQEEDTWAADMLAHARQDTGPVQLKHEDSGFASGELCTSDDDDDDEAFARCVATLPQSSPKRSKPVLGLLPADTVDTSSYAEPSLSSGATLINTPSRASQTSVASPDTDEKRDLLLMETKKTDDLHKHIHMKDASTQTTNIEYIETPITVAETPAMAVKDTKLDITRWLSKVESKGKDVIFWLFMAFVLDTLLRIA